MHLKYYNQRHKLTIAKMNEFYNLFNHGARKNKTAEILCSEIALLLGAVGRKVLDNHNVVIGYETKNFKQLPNGKPYTAKFRKLKPGTFLADNHPVLNRGGYRYNPEKRIKYEEAPSTNPQPFRVVLLDGRLMTIKKKEQLAIFKELVAEYRKLYHDRTHYFVKYY